MKSKKNFVASVQDVRLRRLSKAYQNTSSNLDREPSQEGASPSAKPYPVVAPRKTLKEKKKKRKAEAKKRISSQHPLQKNHAPSLKQVKWDQQLEDLIQADRPWKEFSELAWREYTLDPTDRHAAKLVELAFLHGSHEDILSCFERLLNLGKESFYLHLDNVLRQKLISFFFHSRLQDRFLWMLERAMTSSKSSVQLGDQEKALLILMKVKTKNHHQVLNLLKEVKEPFLEQMDELCSKLNLEPTRIRLDIATLAIKCGDDRFAIDLLSPITFDSQHYKEAMSVLRQARQSAYHENHTKFFAKFAKSSNSKRIEILKTKLKELNDHRDKTEISEISMMDKLFSKLNVLTFNDEQLSMLFKNIVQHKELCTLIPSLFEPIRLKHADFGSHLKFFRPFKTLPSEPGIISYMQGVSGLHHFFQLEGVFNEKILWEYRKQVMNNHIGVEKYGFEDWNTLVDLLIQRVSKREYADEKEKNQFIRALAISKTADQINLQTVHEYLENTEIPEISVLRELRKLPIAQNNSELKFQLTQKFIPVANKSDGSLIEVWKVAAELEKHDLAWRVASVMESRGELPEQMYHAWRVSGESRSIYTGNQLQKSDLYPCLTGFEDLQKSFIKSLFHFQDDIAGLVRSLGYATEKHKYFKLMESPLQMQAYQLIDQIMPFPKYRTVLLRSGQEPTFVYAPPFCKMMPDNLWSHVFAMLCERLNLRLFNWNHAALADLCHSLPQISKTNHKATVKYMKWFRSLSLESKEVWQNLPWTVNQLDQAGLTESVQKFAARVTTLILSNHPLAIDTSKKFGLPESVIRDLESWIMSKTYTQFREARHIENKVPVPKILMSWFQ